MYLHNQELIQNNIEDIKDMLKQHTFNIRDDMEIDNPQHPLHTFHVKLKSYFIETHNISDNIASEMSKDILESVDENTNEKIYDYIDDLY
jgi:hypothetical protein